MKWWSALWHTQTQTAEREEKDGLGSTRRQLDNDSGSDIVICSLLL